MFNEDRKNAYLGILKKTGKSILKRVFEKSEVAERNNNVDICDMSTESVLEILAVSCGTTLRGVDATLSEFRGYIKWCKGNGIRVNEDLVKIKDRDVDISVEIGNVMSSSPLGLEESLNKCFNGGEGSDDCLARTYFWFAYSGFDKDDIFNVKVSDVDFKKNVINFGGKSYKIYPKSISDIKNACFLESFSFWSTIGYPYSKPRVGKEYVFRTIKSEKTNPVTFRQGINRKLKKSGFSITYADVYTSGLFYRKFIEEKEGGCDYFEGYPSLQRRNLLWSYEMWKKAFDLNV